MTKNTYVRVKINPTGEFVWVDKDRVIDVGPDRLEVTVKTSIGSPYPVNVPKITLEQADTVLAKLDKGEVVVLKWNDRYLNVIGRLAIFSGFALIGDFMGNKLILSYACTPAMINTPDVINLSDIRRLENEIDNFDTGVEVIDVGSDVLTGLISGFIPRLTDTLVSTIANTFIRGGKQVLIKWDGNGTTQHILVVGASDTRTNIAIMYTYGNNTYLITYVYGDVDNPNVVQIKEGGGGSGSNSPLDVRIDGASIVENGVANIPIATSSNLGVVKGSGTAGVAVINGVVTVDRANQTEIDQKWSAYKPIVPAMIDYAVKVGLTTNTLSLTDAEQQAAQEWLGIEGGTSGLFLADGQFPNGLTQSTATAIVNNISAASEMPFIAISNGVDVGVVTSYKRQSNLTHAAWVTIGSKVYEYWLTATDVTYVEFTASAPIIYDLKDIGDIKTALDVIIEIQNTLIGGNS